MIKKKASSADDWVHKAFKKQYLDIYSHRNNSEAERHCKSLVKLAQLDSHSLKILDCCCGAARYSRILENQGFNVIGMDLSYDLIKVAKQEEPNGNYCRGDIRALPFRNSFDRLLSLFTSFGYFEDDEENLRVLMEMHSSLKKGGLLYLDYLNPINVMASDWEEKSDKNGVIRSKKSINQKTQMVIKQVEWFSEDGNNSQYDERVKLYMSDWFIENGKKSGFECIGIYGDYSGGKLKKDSPRNVYLFEKI